MEVEFLPSWINAIDESMSKWLNEYTCPGFMYIPRKPWKFGNEWVAQVMSFGASISEKARIVHDTWERRSMMVWAEQWELCCI